VDASQVFAKHVAAVSVFPLGLHIVNSLTVKAELHVGWQVLPAAMLLVQLPTAPLAGAVDPSQVFG
jgi:hypothetical protein